jgi:dUTP pyrophosphatase
MIIDFNDNIIRFSKIKEGATIPSKRLEDGAMDIYACIDKDIQIKPHGIVKIPTGIKSAFSPKYRIVFQERGSTGQIGLKVNAGLIDSGFRAEWFVILNNTSDIDIVIHKTDKKEDVIRYYDYVYYPSTKAICQCKVQEVPLVEITEESEDQIMKYESERKEGSLGSSNK